MFSFVLLIPVSYFAFDTTKTTERLDPERNLAKKKQVESILEAFELAPNKHNWIPSDRDYTVGISCCGKVTKWQHACLLLDKMAIERVSPNIFSYSAAISACEKGGEWQHALALLKTMPEESISPSVISYNAAISACEKGGEWQYAMLVFESMIEARVNPDVISSSGRKRM